MDSDLTTRAMAIGQETERMANDLAQRALQAGRDEMAEALANYLTERHAHEDQHYLDGVEDALATLIQHGATDPR